MDKALISPVVVAGNIPVESPFVRVCRMAPREVDKWWTYVSGFVKAALDRSKGEITPAGVRECIKKGSMQMWLVVEVQSEVRFLAGCVTQVIDYEQFSVLRVVILGGSEVDKWGEALFGVLKAFAHEQGLKYIEAVGRRGLWKRLSKLGFEPTYVTYHLEVNYGPNGRNDEDNKRDEAS